MSESKWLVVMQRSDKDVNNGIRLSHIFTLKGDAEQYAERKRETGNYEEVHVIMRSEF